MNDVIKGTDITEHYMDTNNKRFKLFRYQGEVYAIQYDTNKAMPIAAITMWKSYKEEENTLYKIREDLGQGAEGHVYSKTKDKVVKEFNYSDAAEQYKEINLELLEQKFLLAKHEVDHIFIFGLYNIKNPEKIVQVMPKIENSFNEKIYPKQFDDFIKCLKKTNELGLAHPDYKNSPFHTSIQNQMITEKGIKLIDLSNGLQNLAKLKEDGHPRASAMLRDQWLLVYTQKQQGIRGLWRDKLNDWYKEEYNNRALSESLETLLTYYEQGYISLPPTIARDIILDAIKNHNYPFENIPERFKDDIEITFAAKNPSFKQINSSKGIEKNTLENMLNSGKNGFDHYHSAKENLSKLGNDILTTIKHLQRSDKELEPTLDKTLNEIRKIVENSMSDPSIENSHRCVEQVAKLHANAQSKLKGSLLYFAGCIAIIGSVVAVLISFGTLSHLSIVGVQIGAILIATGATLLLGIKGIKTLSQAHDMNQLKTKMTLFQVEIENTELKQDEFDSTAPHLNIR